MTPEQARIAKANRLVYEAYNRPFIQCLRADSVKVTWCNEYRHIKYEPTGIKGCYKVICYE